MEQNLASVSGLSLDSLFFCSKTPACFKALPGGVSIKAIHKVCSFLKFPIVHCAMQPLWLNPNICIGGNTIYFSEWSDKGIKLVADLLPPGGLCKFPDVQSKFNLNNIDLLKCLQLTHSISAQFGRADRLSSYCHEHLPWGRNPPRSHCVSFIYKHLIAHLSGTPSRIMDKWANYLSVAVDDINWNSVWKFMFKPFFVAAHKLTQFRIVHDLYLTPRHLYHMGVRENDVCPKCISAPGSLFHFLWDCPVIGKFWGDIKNSLNPLLGVSDYFTPRVCLLGDMEGAQVPHQDRNTIALFALAAKHMILKYWISPSVPAVWEWLTDILDIIKLDRLAPSLKQIGKPGSRRWDMVLPPLTLP
nr:PREDICTED: uncharacterized protein LOC102345338 [Latimeria chalumnae]XP_014349766.1 PREDICTED: uncharacterized protein LOC102345338 [Latimeria chalumnae]|eukprot:XP_014349765.1 PREDICTED: uncharacterized protein LOC102345338 [Latimeria chalumnae]